MSDNEIIEKNIQENRQAYNLPVFEIFNMKLHYDDLLIIGLLFFLYSQNVRDDELFLVLLLLLF